MPVYKNKNNNSYYIKTYVTVDGKSKQITRRNKEWIGRDGKLEAEQEEIRLKTSYKKKKEEALINNEVNEQKSNDITIETKNIIFGDLIKKYKDELKKYTKESTLYGNINIIQNQIIPYFNQNIEVKSITSEDILKWHDELNKKEYSIRYRKKCHTILSSILEIGTSFFGIQNNVAKIVGSFKQTQKEKEKNTLKKLRYITLEEFKTFISYVNDETFYVYFNILYFTGMRKGEIQALTWNDVDFKNRQLIVNKSLTVKTNEGKWKITSTKNLKNRKIDIDTNLANILYEYFIKKKQNKNFSMDHFILGNTEPLKQHRIDDNKSKYFKLSGITEITNHEFRHSHVSLMANEYLKSGETDTAKFFVIMSNRLGHTIKVMQETYLHLFPDVQAPIVNLIEKLNQT